MMATVRIPFVEMMMDIDGIYIEDTALDARSLRRTRRILDRKPGSLIDFHTWNHFATRPATPTT